MWAFLHLLVGTVDRPAEKMQSFGIGCRYQVSKSFSERHIRARSQKNDNGNKNHQKLPQIPRTIVQGHSKRPRPPTLTLLSWALSTAIKISPSNFVRRLQTARTSPNRKVESSAVSTLTGQRLHTKLGVNPRWGQKSTAPCFWLSLLMPEILAPTSMMNGPPFCQIVIVWGQYIRCKKERERERERGREREREYRLQTPFMINNWGLSYVAEYEGEELNMLFLLAFGHNACDFHFQKACVCLINVAGKLV